MAHPVNYPNLTVFDKKLQRELIDAKADEALNQIVVKSVPTGQLTGPSQVQIHPARGGAVVASVATVATAPGCPQVIQEVMLCSRVICFSGSR